VSSPAPVKPQRSAGAPARPAGLVLRGTPLAMAGKIVGLGLVLALTVWLAPPLAAQQNWLMLALLVLSAVAIFAIYLQPWKIPPKYLVPGVVFLILFQIVPVVYTVGTAFTNFGDAHRGTKAAAIADIKAQSVQPVAGAPEYYLTVATKGDPATAPLVFLLVDPTTKAVQIGTDSGLEPAVNAQVSATNKVTSLDGGYTILNVGQAAARSADMAKVSVPTPQGTIKSEGLSRAVEGKATRSYDTSCDCITDSATGQTWKADDSRGYFVDSTGANLAQGWQVNVGLSNWAKPFSDPVLRGSFLSMLAWNFAFALISVFGTFAVGLLMAMALNSDRVKGLRFYRVLIVLPYAMPAFAMLLVWRDMFNQDFGLINNLFHLDVNWFGGPISAKIAVLIVQFWLGYPYMFLVTTGALQAIPADLVEAAAVDGASRWFAFRTVTLPLLFVATAPLLISSFAFNFNNFNAIKMTSDGGPFPPDSPSVGATDLLISYTYRLAFGAGGGAQYGLAAAMSILIFFIVAIVSVISFKRTAALEDIN
jgi:arabinogalactan oligomer/maltooligosaccharide transport system permease protein